MNARFTGPMKTLALMLVAVITAVCAVTVAQAAMAGADMAACSGRVCDQQLACGASAQNQSLRPSPTLPAAILSPAEVLVTPAQAIDLVARAPVDVGRDRAVAPLAPRSPPGA